MDITYTSKGKSLLLGVVTGFVLATSMAQASELSMSCVDSASPHETVFDQHATECGSYLTTPKASHYERLEHTSHNAPPNAFTTSDSVEPQEIKLDHIAELIRQQDETTAECDEGVIAEPVPLVYGNSTVGCNIGASPTDTDRFTFSGLAGETVRLRMVTLTNNLDPSIEIRDSGNMLVDSFGCSSSTFARCSTGLTVELPVTGGFLVIVSETGADNTGSYTLQLERILPPPTSVAVNYDEAVVDSIGPTTDTDFFVFNATAGTTLQLNAVTLTNNLDLRFQVYDPDDILVIDTVGCNASTFARCSYAVNLTPTVTGVYSLQVFDDDAFNGGDYQFSLWCVFGDCDGAPVPDSNGPQLNYVLDTEDTIEALTDGDFYTFNATSGSTVILRGVTLTNNLDPHIEVRDPTGDLIVSGAASGAGCNASTFAQCSFGFTLLPTMSGTYTVRISDNDSFNTGSYRISLLCVLGDCDGDNDGLFDNDREILSYGVAVTDKGVSPGTEGDFYQFMGSSGDEIRITVTGQSNNFDPGIQVHDPDGVRIVSGIAEGAGCNASTFTQCSFSTTLFPTTTGVYSLMIIDDDAFNPGEYDISLECIFGTGPGFTCVDLEVPPFLCADNCSAVDNPSQRDTDADGYGNYCDPDFDNDGNVNFTDISAWVPFFNTVCGDVDEDINGDGICNFADFSIIVRHFLTPPGPSCSYPNSP